MCGNPKLTFIKARRIWQCNAGHRDRKQFSVKVGTIFEDSPLGLDKWFTAAWMVANCKNGVSSYEIHRAIGVTQKTAWFMDHRIRLAMQSGTFEKVAVESLRQTNLLSGASPETCTRTKRPRSQARAGPEKRS